MKKKLPTLKECVQKRINHVCETTGDGIFIYTYAEDGDKIYKRNTSGDTYEVIDRDGHAAVDSDGIVVELPDERFYELYAACKYGFTQSPDDPEVYKCAEFIPPKPTLYNPTCPHCGQGRLPDRNFATQAEADEHAALGCECSGARNYQAECRRKADRDKNITKIRQAIDGFNYYCENKSQTLTDEIKGILFNCGVMTLDGLIGGAAVQFGRVKAKIGTNAKGAVVVTFAYSDCVKAEV
jgi:hypothetical protein